MENDREGMVLRRAHIVRPFSFARMQKMLGALGHDLGAPYGKAFYHVKNKLLIPNY